ncbi:hypothetical protein GCM10010254_35580 [Streptomyces chromofuscus]|nr:hypothetical protein GCM10010254_35580 [Streptomyces chromofuscus]
MDLGGGERPAGAIGMGAEGLEEAAVEDLARPVLEDECCVRRVRALPARLAGQRIAHPVRRVGLLDHLVHHQADHPDDDGRHTDEEATRTATATPCPASPDGAADRSSIPVPYCSSVTISARSCSR